MKSTFFGISVLATLALAIFPTTSLAESEAPAYPQTSEALARYLAQTFQFMDENYYLPVSKKTYEVFVNEYTADRLRYINGKTHQTDSFIHLGGGLLVNRLKDAADKFTNLIPPKKTEAFKETAYAITVDLGLEGLRTDAGFELTSVQKHSDAYEQGIRPGDVILEIDGIKTLSLDEAEIASLLDREVGTQTLLLILYKETGETTEINLENKSYFVETAFQLPVSTPNVLAIQVTHFNRMTSRDVADILQHYQLEALEHVIIDLRNNTGGPPLAARELMGFFVPPNDILFYIIRKNKSPFQLNAPIGYPLYKGPLTILVNQNTGSAAETFSGVLQHKKRAVVAGQLTAGGAYLKSIYDYEDGSALLMVTSRTFFHDRQVFPNDGIQPDIIAPTEKDTLEFVADHLKKNENKPLR